MMATLDLEFTLNRQTVRRKSVDPDLMLVDFLREELGLTGTKFCCGIAVCRVCTVALARVPGAHQVAIRACTTPVREVHQRVLTTVEGLADGDAPHPLQQAFLDNFSFQCGYCCPGFLMAAYALLDQLERSPIPRQRVDEVVQEAVGQHICRCTGYVRYHRAIRQVILETPGLVTEEAGT